MVLEKGFAWNGNTYSSLSQIAKAMTGTSWNGHRFFGLRPAGGGVKDKSGGLSSIGRAKTRLKASRDAASHIDDSDPLRVALAAKGLWAHEVVAVAATATSPLAAPSPPPSVEIGAEILSGRPQASP